MSQKTNAARLLDQQNLNYEMVEYPVDIEDLSATHVAEELGIDPNRIYKTLVLEGNQTGYFVCILPAKQHLDLKKAAQVSNNKKCDMIPVNDLKKVTGYIRGGCSPLGMKKQFPTFLEEMANLEDMIWVSAGKRGFLLKLSPSDLVKASQAEFADLMEV